MILFIKLKQKNVDKILRRSSYISCYNCITVKWMDEVNRQDWSGALSLQSPHDSLLRQWSLVNGCRGILPRLFTVLFLSIKNNAATTYLVFSRAILYGNKYRLKTFNYCTRPRQWLNIKSCHNIWTIANRALLSF